MVSLDSVHIVYLQAYRAAKPLKPPSPQTTKFFGWLISYLLFLFLFLFVGVGSIQSKAVVSDFQIDDKSRLQDRPPPSSQPPSSARCCPIQPTPYPTSSHLQLTTFNIMNIFCKHCNTQLLFLFQSAYTGTGHCMRNRLHR